jgi:NADPH:quinone reductase-like Zn-dependent oxidoreductase
VPDGCDLVAAGALPAAFGTTHVALVHRAQLKSGQVGFEVDMGSLMSGK